MHRRHAISPGFTGHYHDLGTSSLKRHDSACNLISLGRPLVPALHPSCRPVCAEGILLPAFLALFVPSNTALALFVPSNTALALFVLSNTALALFAQMAERGSRAVHALSPEEARTAHLLLAQPMSCAQECSEVINLHTVGSLPIPRASIKWVSLWELRAHILNMHSYRFAYRIGRDWPGYSYARA